MTIKKSLLLLLLVAAIGLFLLFDLQRFFNVEFLQSQREAIQLFQLEHFWLSRLLYFLLYVIVTALSLPAAAIVTLAGGAIFGFWWGLVLVSFASSIGATLAFLMARTLLRDWVQRRFGQYLEPINRGIQKDGISYLFTLRLIPVFPFVLVNLIMALTPVSTLTFYLVSQLGMLFGTALYVNVGAQLGLVSELPQVLSLNVLAAIAVLAVFPWLAKAVAGRLRDRRGLRGFRRPSRFDTNLVVIGAGAAGLVTAYIAAHAKARVTLIEKNLMGGDCLNTGCVPSKALLRSAGVSSLLQRAGDFGIQTQPVSTDFAAVMQRVQNKIARIAPHDSVERYSAMGVDCVDGEAEILSPWLVRVNGKELTTRAIVLATGASPVIPDIPGLQDVSYLSSDTLWGLQTLPERLLVLGAGPVGCELAQAFARLGSVVTIINKRDHLLPSEDQDVAAQLESRFLKEGIRFLNGATLEKFVTDGTEQKALVCHGKQQETLIFDQVLIAYGRKANTAGFGLEQLGVTLTDTGSIQVNEYLQSSCPTIYACGDVAGPYQFTHMASFQAWFASINALFGSFWRSPVHYRIVPRSIFTEPEVARVGLNEKEAQLAGTAYETVQYDIEDLDRAITEDENYGFIKVLTVPGKDKILGVTIVGYHAAELLQQFTLAMTHGLGLKKIMGTIHAYPTLSESGKYAAGQWQREHTPQWIMPWLKKLHSFRR